MLTLAKWKKAKKHNFIVNEKIEIAISRLERFNKKEAIKILNEYKMPYTLM